jgi:hypothetical protein
MHENTATEVHQESLLTKKICTQDSLGYICHYEGPVIELASDAQREDSLAERSDR